jgi:hypothetical protein
MADGNKNIDLSEQSPKESGMFIIAEYVFIDIYTRAAGLTPPAIRV